MSKLLSLFTLNMLIIATLFSQNEYSVDNIPENLKKNAGSVIRQYDAELKITSPSQAQLKKKYVITILHESHKKKAKFHEFYDNFSKISNIKITIFDKTGKKVLNVSRSDIKDMSAFADNALFAEIRQKNYIPVYNMYPYTIEYSYTMTYNGILSYPSYIPIDNYETSFEKGSFVVRKNGKLRYLNRNFDGEPSISDKDNELVYKWEFNNLKAVRHEDYEMRFEHIIPIVTIAPNDFEMDGWKGNSESWESFGKWIYTLGMGRDELPEKTILEVKSLTDSLLTKREKTKAIYEYMQAKTRYVNIIIGIGGWQPTSAMEVDDNGYGDCKGLSNYTYSLLKAVGIESYYTLIKAGKPASDIYCDFPTNQFNHAILCVPDGIDTIWLECTNQRNPFNYLSSYTEGRKALIISEDSSKLVDTPVLNSENNYRIRKADIDIYTNGDAVAEIANNYGGSYYDYIYALCYLEGKRRMDWVRKSIHVKNFTMVDSDYFIEDRKSEVPEVVEHYHLVAKKYAKNIGERLLININFFNTEVDVPSSVNKQETDIYIGYSGTKIDSLTFIIPENYYIKSFPSNDTLVSPYGKFYTNYILDGSRLKYTRKQIINKGTYPASQYSSLRDYLKKISLADNGKILIMEK